LNINKSFFLKFVLWNVSFLFDNNNKLTIIESVMECFVLTLESCWIDHVCWIMGGEVTGTMIYPGSMG